MTSTLTMQSTYLNNDITSLIVNVLKFVCDLGQQPSLIDFMNYVRRYKIDTRESLYDAIVRVVKMIDPSHKKQTKILVHKNPEGMELKPRDHQDMINATVEDHTLMILYAVDVSIERNGDETFKHMKNRYRNEDKAKWAMYSRDDYVIKTIHSSFIGSNVCSPVLHSKDLYKDSRKYKYIEPFQVWMFVCGKSYRFLFDYSLLKHTDLMMMISILRLNLKKKMGKSHLICQSSDINCINKCPGKMCDMCKNCTMCKQSE